MMPFKPSTFAGQKIYPQIFTWTQCTMDTSEIAVINERDVHHKNAIIDHNIRTHKYQAIEVFPKFRDKDGINLLHLCQFLSIAH